MYINDPLTATKANTHTRIQTGLYSTQARQSAPRSRRLDPTRTRLLVRVRPGVGLALVLLVEQAVVPSGIDEQGVDHGGLLLRLSHLPAADATQRRLELVGEGEVVAPQLKAPAPPRRRVGAAEAVGEGGPPVKLVDGVLDVLEVVAEPPVTSK